MFDVNLDSAKCYLKDLERQATAYRRLHEELPRVRLDSASRRKGLDSPIEARGRHPARMFASAMRGVAAMVF